MLWGSLFLGFFASNVNYLGGTFGYYLNEWLILALGQFGTLILILVTFFVITTLLFSPNYRAIFAYLFATKEKEVVQESVDLEDKDDRIDDIHVINPIREDQIMEDILSEPLDFSKNDEEDECSARSLK
jgi:hypothetical protein